MLALKSGVALVKILTVKFVKFEKSDVAWINNGKYEISPKPNLTIFVDSIVPEVIFWLSENKF